MGGWVGGWVGGVRVTQRAGAEDGVERARGAEGRTDLLLRLLVELHQHLVGGPHLVGPDLVRSRLRDRDSRSVCHRLFFCLGRRLLPVRVCL